jgi:hypothetical protein
MADNDDEQATPTESETEPPTTRATRASTKRASTSSGRSKSSTSRRNKRNDSPAEEGEGGEPASPTFEDRVHVDEVPIIDDEEHPEVAAPRRRRRNQLSYELDLGDSTDRRSAARRGAKPAPRRDVEPSEDEEPAPPPPPAQPRREPNPAWVILAREWARAPEPEPVQPPPPPHKVRVTQQAPLDDEAETQHDESAPPFQPDMQKVEEFILGVPITDAEPPERQRRVAAIVGALVAGAIILGLGIAIGHRSDDNDGAPSPTTATSQPTGTGPTMTTPTSNPATSNNTSTSSTSTTSDGKTTVVQLSGSGDRQSGLFELPSGPVTVNYSTSGGTLDVKLLRQQSTGSGDNLQCNGACNRTATLTEDAGTYYLDVKATNGDWTVRVAR